MNTYSKTETRKRDLKWEVVFSSSLRHSGRLIEMALVLPISDVLGASGICLFVHRCSDKNYKNYWKVKFEEENK